MKCGQKRGAPTPNIAYENTGNQGCDLPLVKEAKGHTYRHVVYTEWYWVSLICGVLKTSDITICYIRIAS